MKSRATASALDLRVASAPPGTRARLRRRDLRQLHRLLASKVSSARAAGAGAFVRLNPDQQRSATDMTRLFSAVIWGHHNSSYTVRIGRDERALLSTWLRNTVWNSSVLEVGCGSGRITAAIASLAVQALAIDR